MNLVVPSLLKDSFEEFLLYSFNIEYSVALETKQFQETSAIDFLATVISLSKCNFSINDSLHYLFRFINDSVTSFKRSFLLCCLSLL